MGEYYGNDLFCLRSRISEVDTLYSTELSTFHKGYVRSLLEYGDVVWLHVIKVLLLKKCKKELAKQFLANITALPLIQLKCANCRAYTLFDRRKNHSRKFGQSLPNC